MKEYTEYELIYIISIDDFEKTDSIREEVRQIIKDNGGKIIKESDPQKRKLAYPIKRKKSGAYLISRVLIEKEKIKEIRQQLEIKENVLRHLFILAESLPDSKEEEEVMTDNQENKKTVEVAKAKKPEITKPEIIKEVEKTPVPSVSKEKVPKVPMKKADSQPEKKPITEDKKEKTLGGSISTPKDKLKLEELDKKIDDILKDDLI